MTIEERQKEIIGEVIRLRHEQGITQKRLGELSGVQQPVIARTEKNTTAPNLTTLMKLLVPLGRTLAVVPLPREQED